MTSVAVGVFRARCVPAAVTFPVTEGPDRPEPLQPIAEPLEVLLNAVLDHLGAVPDVAQVRVDPRTMSSDPWPSSRATV